jgi:UDP-N-acetylmuramoylalanine--D-glutamate ligase
MSLFDLGLRKPYGIVGLGKSGLALLHLLLKLGVPRSEIFTFDDRSQEADFNHPDLFLQNPVKTLFVSPGVPLSTPWIQGFETRGGRISNEFELSFSMLQTERVVGVTGSIGKSTVTSLLHAGALAIDPNAFAGGNLGTPLATYISDVMEGRPRAQFINLEISSYQLERFKNLDLELGVITYLTPNHLDRYPSLENYYDTKLILGERCVRGVICNSEGGDLKSFVEKRRPRWPETFWCSKNDEVMTSLQVRHCSLVGQHNMDNLALAVRVARLMNWDAKSLTAMQDFKGLPHRLQLVATIKGVRFINDSKATALDSVENAISSVLSEQPKRILLLIGGKDKGLPWERLRGLKDHQKVVPFLFGADRGLIAEKTGLSASPFERLEDLLKNLEGQLKDGDVVLLSPGGTSVDQFKSFEHRGEVFTAWVESLKS